MRRFGLLAAITLLLAACAPQLYPVAEREGESVVITMTASAPIYDITLHVFEATTDDVRCAVLSSTDLGCLMGDLAPGEELTLVVEGEPGRVTCMAFGFYREDLSLSSYRPYPCQTGGA